MESRQCVSELISGRIGILTIKGGVHIDKVADLIDPYSGQWDENLVNSILFRWWMLHVF